MPTGDALAVLRSLAAAALILGVLLAATGCEEIEEPVVSLSLQASDDTVRTDENVTVTATVTEDENPLAGVNVLFSASPVGSFPGGDEAVTDAGGQAETTFVVSTEEIESDTIVEVTATEAESQALDTVEIFVEADDRGPR
jgi:hypothetical protein